jgi:hypothetical protein
MVPEGTKPFDQADSDRREPTGSAGFAPLALASLFRSAAPDADAPSPGSEGAGG